MPRQLHTLPRGQVTENRFSSLFELLLDLRNFRLKRDAWVLLELVEFPLQLNYGLLEIEIMFHTRPGWAQSLSGRLAPRNTVDFAWPLVWINVFQQSAVQDLNRREMHKSAENNHRHKTQEEEAE